MSEYSPVKQEPQDRYDNGSSRIQHQSSTSDHDKKDRRSRPNDARYSRYHKDDSSPRRRRRSAERERSISPSMHSRAVSRSRRERSHGDSPNQVEVWTGHSYTKIATGYVVGIGLQFDNQIKTRLQVAIFAENNNPSHRAELISILLILAVLKSKKLEDVKVTINTNQPLIVRVMESKDHHHSEGRTMSRIQKFVCECVEQWARPVRLRLASGSDDVPGMKAAKSHAVMIRKIMEPRCNELSTFPQCLWSTIYGDGLASYLNIPKPRNTPPLISDFLSEATVGSTLAHPAGNDIQRPTPQTDEPLNQRKARIPSPPAEKPSGSKGKSTAPKHWPKDLPYPIPFGLASNLIAQIVALTAPPTPEEVSNMTSELNPVAIPQQQQSGYYPTQQSFMRPPPPPSQAPLYQATPPPYPPQYFSGSQHQLYPPQGSPYYHSHQQLALRSPIYPDRQPTQSPNLSEYNNTSTRSTDIQRATPTEGSGYGSTLIYPSRTGTLDLNKQPTEDPMASQQTPPQTPGYQIPPKV